MKNLAILLIIITFILFLFFPLYIMLKISVSEPVDVFTQKPSYLIRHFTLNHFKNVLLSGSTFFSPLKKSFIVAFFASVLSLLISIPAAYAISKFSYGL